MAILAIDFETANESRASPCALGLAWIEGTEVVRREYRLIRPKEMRFGIFESRVHGLYAHDVEDAPEFPDVIAEFLPDISGGVLLAHNARFDVDVLCATFAAYGLAAPAFSYLCSLRIAKTLWPQHPSHKLNALGEMLGISFRHHHAADDADVCARIVLAAANELGVRDVLDVAAPLSLRAGYVDAEGVVACDGMTAPRGGPSMAQRYFRRHADYPLQPRQRKPASDFHFIVRGSAGNIYNIRDVAQPEFELGCDCQGWRTGRRCRHIHGLLHGVIDDLVSDNSDDLKRLQQVLQLRGFPKPYLNWEPPTRGRQASRW